MRRGHARCLVLGMVIRMARVQKKSNAVPVNRALVATRCPASMNRFRSYNVRVEHRWGMVVLVGIETNQVGTGSAAEWTRSNQPNVT